MDVGRFLSLNLGESGPSGARPAVAGRPLVDRWVLSHLTDTVTEATQALESYDYAAAYQASSRMFWSVYCDRYLEMIKDRVTDASAQWTLWETYRVLLGLRPVRAVRDRGDVPAVLPAARGGVSLHVSSWPSADPGWASDRSAVDQLVVILDATRALRSQHKLGNSTRLRLLTLGASSPAADALLAQIAEPLRVAARADAVSLSAADYPSGVDGVTVDIAV